MLFFEMFFAFHVGDTCHLISAQKTAVPPLVDHGLFSCRVVRVVMALDQACVGSSLLVFNLKSTKICENPLPLLFFYFVSFKKRSVLGKVLLWFYCYLKANPDESLQSPLCSKPFPTKGYLSEFSKYFSRFPMTFLNSRENMTSLPKHSISGLSPPVTFRTNQGFASSATSIPALDTAIEISTKTMKTTNSKNICAFCSVHLYRSANCKIRSLYFVRFP